MPCFRPVASMNPTAFATASGGSSSSPKVSARKKNVSESVEPSISGYSDGSTAKTRSRFTTWKSRITPLCIHSHLSYRNGWQFVSCTGLPVDARMWAKTSGERMCAASSCRLRSFQAGSMLW